MSPPSVPAFSAFLALWPALGDNVLIIVELSANARCGAPMAAASFTLAVGLTILSTQEGRAGVCACGLWSGTRLRGKGDGVIHI